MIKIILLMLMVFCVAAAEAQTDECAVASQSAFVETAESCNPLDPYQVCYGSGDIMLQSRRENTIFDEAGDTIPLDAVGMLTLDSSIAVMTPRANLPDENLTLVAFGGVTLTNQSSTDADFIALEVTAKRQGALIRLLPDATSEVVEPLNWGESVMAVGRLENGDWLNVLLPEGTGWVEVDHIESEAKLELLKAYEAPTEIALSSYGAMQAFDIGEIGNCAGESGVLAQTPLVEALIVVNYTEIRFDGTIYLQREEARLYVNVLEGQATVDEAFTVETGEATYVRLDEDGRYDGLSSTLEPYFYTRVRNTPYILLPRFIELPFSMAGLLEPFTPGTGFLTGMKLEDPCTVVWTEAVNVRSGPGTNYPVLEGIPANFAARPTARATGTDGGMWWYLAEGIWLFAGNTVFGGNCATLPTAELPPLP